MTRLQETETRPDAYDTALRVTVTDVLDFHCMVAVWLGLVKHCGLGLKSVLYLSNFPYKGTYVTFVMYLTDFSCI